MFEQDTSKLALVEYTDIYPLSVFLYKLAVKPDVSEIAHLQLKKVNVWVISVLSHGRDQRAPEKKVFSGCPTWASPIFAWWG